MNGLNMRGIMATARRPTSTAPKKSTTEKTSASMKRPRIVNAPTPACTLGFSASISDDTATNSRSRPPIRSGAYKKRMASNVRAE